MKNGKKKKLNISLCECEVCIPRTGKRNEDKKQIHKMELLI